MKFQKKIYIFFWGGGGVLVVGEGVLGWGVRVDVRVEGVELGESR